MCRSKQIVGHNYRLADGCNMCLGGGTVVSNVAQRLAIRVDYLLIINVSGYETFYGVYIFSSLCGSKVI